MNASTAGAALFLVLSGLMLASDAEAKPALWIDHQPPAIVAIPVNSPAREELDPQDLVALEAVAAGFGRPASEEGSLAGVTLIDVAHSITPSRSGATYTPISEDRLDELMQGCTVRSSFVLPTPSIPDRDYYGFAWNCPGRRPGNPIFTVIGISNHRPFAVYVHTGDPSWIRMPD